MHPPASTPAPYRTGAAAPASSDAHTAEVVARADANAIDAERKVVFQVDSDSLKEEVARSKIRLAMERRLLKSSVADRMRDDASRLEPPLPAELLQPKSEDMSSEDLRQLSRGF